MKGYSTIFFESDDCGKVGIKSAIILNFIRRSILTQRVGLGIKFDVDDDKNVWVSFSSSLIISRYQFMTKRQVNYAIKKLIDDGEILVREESKRKKFYRIAGINTVKTIIHECANNDIKEEETIKIEYKSYPQSVDYESNPNLFTEQKCTVNATKVFRNLDDTLYIKKEKNKTIDLTVKESGSTPEKFVLFSSSLRKVLVEDFFATDKSISVMEGLYTEDKVLEKIIYIKSLASYSAKKIYNLMGYLMSVLKSNFGKVCTSIKKNLGGVMKMEKRMEEFYKNLSESDNRQKVSRYIRESVSCAFFKENEEFIKEKREDFIKAHVDGNEVMTHVYRKNGDLFHGMLGAEFVKYLSSISEFRNKLDKNVSDYLQGNLGWLKIMEIINYKLYTGSLDVNSVEGNAHV